jgi:hypothetical protein
VARELGIAPAIAGALQRFAAEQLAAGRDRVEAVR